MDLPKNLSLALRNTLKIFFGREAEEAASTFRRKTKKLSIGVNDSNADINITDGSETDSGWAPPEGSVVREVVLEVLTAESTGGTKTLDVGTDSSGSGDADGLLVGADVSSAVTVLPSLASTGQTRGALIRDDESGAGVLVPSAHVAGTDNVTVTAGSADFAELEANLYVVYDEVDGE